MQARMIRHWTFVLILAVVLQSLQILHVKAEENGKLEFVPSSLYQSTITESQAAVSGTPVVTLGFNRGLKESERRTLGVLKFGEYKKFSFNNETFVITVKAPLSIGTVKVIVFVRYNDSGGTEQQINAIITINIIDDAFACQSQSFGKCSQLCNTSTSQTGYTCSCLDNYVLQSDGLTCLVNAPSPLLLLSHSNAISELDTSRSQSSIFYQESESNTSITLFDYSYTNQLLYYVDETSHTIVQVSLSDPTKPEVPLITNEKDSINGIAVDWISGNIFYSDSGKIQQYHVTSGDMTPVLSNLSNPRGIVLMPDNPYRYMFWIEGPDSHSSIKRSSLNGTGVVSIPTNNDHPVAMAIDVIAGNLYWISNDGSVFVSSFDGGNLDIVYTNENTNFSAIAVFEDFVYLTSSSTNEIFRVTKFTDTQGRFTSSVVYNLPLNGVLRDIRVLHPLTQPLTAPDINECLINNGGCGHGCVNTIGSFYCTCRHGYTLSVDERTCVNNTQCSPDILGCDQGCGLDELNNITCLCNPGYILTSDGTTCGDVNECAVKDFCSHGCHNTIGGFQCSCPKGLFLSSDKRNCKGCSINNGGCSQTCITGEDDYRCQCNTGFTLGADDKSCFPQQASDLIFSITREGIGSIVEAKPDGQRQQSLVFPSATQSHQSITGLIYGMDVDVPNGYLYFSDRNDSALWRVKLNEVTSSSDGREKVLDGVKAWGVVYDWINENIYWTEDESGMIRRVSTNTSESFTAESVLTGLDTPQGIVVEPFTGYLYWTEGGNFPRVARALLDDPISSKQTLITAVSNPTGITIDYIHSKLFWADQSNQTIQFSNLDGQNVKTLVTTSSDDSPFQIHISGDELFWTTEGNQSFSVITLTDYNDLVSLDLKGFVNTIPAIYGITSIDDNKRPDSGYHECLVNAPGCSHYCSINNEGDAVCTCPIGYILLDNTTCANVQFCPDSKACQGMFANTFGIPFFPRPYHNGGLVNSLDNPLMVFGKIVNDSCDIVSVEYLDNTCQYTTITDKIFEIAGPLLIGMEPDNPIWGVLNGRVITLSLECTFPLATTFCVSFEISSVDRALSCGFSNGGCSDYCTTDFSPIPVCSCPHGQVLGQNGYTCIDPCEPNPCQNGGVCTLTTDGSVKCTCPIDYSEPFCVVPVQPTCPDDLCDTVNNPSFTVNRLVGGDHVILTEGLSEGYCSAINGYCVGEDGDDCEACRCEPNLSYMYDTGKCEDESCSYKFSQTTQSVPPLYVSSGSLLSVETNTQLPVVHSTTNRPPNNQCNISTVEMNTGEGWLSIASSGFDLSEDNGSTYLQMIETEIPLQQLLGQLLRVEMSCPIEADSGCLLFSFYGNGRDLLSVIDFCDDCQGYLEGYENLGIPTLFRPLESDVPLTDLALMFEGEDVESCNEVGGGVSYYDDQCGLIPVPNNLIYVTLNKVNGRNHMSNDWDIIVGKIINITITCQVGKTFCFLFRLENNTQSTEENPCVASPCANGGSCQPIGQSNYYCTCQTGFTGQTCSQKDYCLSHNCLNNGTCINGPNYASCLCPPDTVPPYCIGPNDKNTGPCLLSPCDNGGICIEEGPLLYYCDCPIGYTGLHCNTIDFVIGNACDSSDICMNGGTCVPNYSSDGYMCVCPDSYTGSNCETICDSPDICMNGGTCVPNDSSDGYMCACLDSYTGSNCETSINICDSPDICMNGGTCVTSSATQYSCNCLEGYTGDNCETDIDECDPNPCENGGTCHEGQPGEGYMCTCITGYTGLNCDVDIDECDSNPCANGGTCHEGQPGEGYMCTCITGYTGLNCDVEIDECDPNPCENGGTCHEGQPGEGYMCTCITGYTGLNCDVDIDECDSNPCENGGTCHEGQPGEGYMCTCITGYTGLNCDVDIDECDPNPCENGGTCHEGQPGEGYMCTCITGYTGLNCDVDIDECDSNPCANGGTCHEGQPGEGYMCTCITGYTGLNCDVEIDECDPNPCENGGTCHEGQPGEGYMCTCITGYTGLNCDEDIDECDPNPCENGGTCHEGQPGEGYMCTCITGYTGLNCDEDIDECDPNPCENGGTCHEGQPGEGYMCTCITGYTGLNCDEDIDECDPNPCENGGTCHEGQPGEGYMCTCITGYTGLNCDVDIDECDPNPCENGGTCHEGQPGEGYMCTCITGYTGLNCDVDIDECDSNPCANGGTCHEGQPGEGYMCTCITGYTGLNCDVDIDECDPNPCENGGTCHEGQPGEGYMCTCITGYTGLNCDEDIDECDPNPCENGGTCHEGQPGEGYMCTCITGYTGLNCDVDIDECDPNPCENGGTCHEGQPGEGYMCTCITGYTGLNCGVDIDECDSNPCENGGTCHEGLPGEGYMCTCITGYTGLNCGVDIDECDSNPCENGGTCHEGLPGEGYMCTCIAGYTGLNCGVDIDECDSNPCENGGTCHEGLPGEGYMCTCITGYTGLNCGVDIDECDSNPCENGGTCHEGLPGEGYMCTCIAGYTGLNCDVDIDECDPNPCENGGTCHEGLPGEGYMCTCITGYTGLNCDEDIDECDPNPCENQGNCSETIVGEFVCSCLPGYTGQTCEDDIDECDGTNLCENGGSCINLSPGFQCDCSPGFIGRSCGQECDEGRYGIDCRETCDCLNGASCSNVDGACICNELYTGGRCETFICDRTCLSSGTCENAFFCTNCPSEYCNTQGNCAVDVLGRPECTCFTGFEGDFCELRPADGQLSRERKGGVSAGVIVGTIILLILVVAAVFFLWKVVFPKYRQKRSRKALWYLDTTLVRDNPAAAEELLDSQYVAHAFRGRGITDPLDNPLYGYVPPRINDDGSFESTTSNELSETIYTDNNEQEFRTDIIPNCVIVNRYIDSSTPEHDEILSPTLDPSQSISPIPDPSQENSKHNYANGSVLVVSISSCDENIGNGKNV